ncbi:MAG: hypothetical protein PHS31_05565 [Victivallaceae bacterium]|nr:hypothetical protein [Victivallaceae bacterium]MDD4182141.1 hypothetical protein [Victivallaceae bacterium]
MTAGATFDTAVEEMTSYIRTLNRVDMVIQFQVNRESRIAAHNDLIEARGRAVKALSDLTDQELIDIRDINPQTAEYLIFYILVARMEDLTMDQLEAEDTRIRNQAERTWMDRITINAISHVVCSRD